MSSRDEEFSKSMRKRLQFWNEHDTLIGKLASIKFFEVGMLEVPRFPILRGIRDVIDL